METINFGQKKTVDALHELVPNGPDVVIEAVGFHYTNSMIHKVQNIKGEVSSFCHLVCFLDSLLCLTSTACTCPVLLWRRTTRDVKHKKQEANVQIRLLPSFADRCTEASGDALWLVQFVLMPSVLPNCRWRWRSCWRQVIHPFQLLLLPAPVQDHLCHGFCCSTLPAGRFDGRFYRREVGCLAVLSALPNFEISFFPQTPATFSTS